jgi:PAS domain S-box-containing protein
MSASELRPPLPKWLRWLPGAYLLVGLLWIVGSDLVLNRLLRHDLESLVYAGTLKGAVFVILSAALLYIAIATSRGTATQPSRVLPLTPGRPLAAFLLVGIGIGLAGYVVYRLEVAEFRDRSERNLVVTAEVTADDLALWRDARFIAMTRLATSPFTGALLADWRSTGSERSAVLLTERLSALRIGNGFDATVFVDPEGQALVTDGGAFDTSIPELRAAIRRSLASRGVAELAPAGSEPRPNSHPLVFIVPVPDRESAVPGSLGALVARATMESALRKIPPSASLGFATLASSVARIRPPGTDRGTGRTVDARGRPVLAVSRPIAGTPYFAVATIEFAEIEQQMRRMMLLIVGMSALGFLAAGALVLPWWLVERARARTLLEQMHVRAEHLATRLDWVTRQANDVILLLDEDGTIVDANDRAEQLYGYSRQELLSMKVKQLRSRDPEERAASQAQLDAVRERGSVLFEAVHLRKDGTPVPVEVSARCVTLDAERYIQSIIRDISRRKEIEQQLRDSEAQYRLLFQSNPRPMWVYDPASLRFLAVNGAAIAEYGYSRAEFLSMTLADIRPPEDVPRLRANVLEHPSEKLQHSGVWRHRRKDGSLLSVEISSHALQFDGQSARLVLVTEVTARLRAEEALRASEDRYRSLFEQASDGLLVSDDRGRILDANAELEVMTGYSREELRGMALPEILDAQEHARLSEYTEALRDDALPEPGPWVHRDLIEYTGTLRDGALRTPAPWVHRRKDGATFPGELRIRILPDGGLLATVRDLTEILSARRHIERQRDLYDLLSQCNQALIQIGDRTALFDRLCQLAVERGRFLLARVDEVGPDDRVVPLARFGEEPGCDLPVIPLIEAVRTGHPVILDDCQRSPRPCGREDTSCPSRTMAALPLHTRSGVAVALTLYGRDSGDFDPEILATLAQVAADVSRALDALQTRRDLEENRLLLQSIINASDAAIYVFDTEGRAVLLNETAARAIGGTIATVIGCTREAFLPAAIAALHAANDQRVIRNGTPMVFEERNVEAGVERLYLSAKSPLRDVEGRVYAVGGISSDITELRGIQQELAESNVRLEEKVAERTREAVAARDRAEAADRAKSLFLSSMSHELRSPLHSIIGFTSVLLEGLEGDLTPVQQEHLRVVADASQHLLAIINDLLDMSRIEANEVSLDSGTVSVRRLLNKIMQRFRLQAQSKGLELKLVEAAGDLMIVGDERRIEQIVMNLVSNAIKFTDQGRVQVTSRIDARVLRIEVSDTGPGITREDQARLFRYFSQIPPMRGRLNEGTGLGLAIARGLAEAMGGRVSLESEPGRGSVFTLVLPIRPAVGDAK